jgi:septal ring factor EnvC (AmiA/AmiB activator)
MSVDERGRARLSAGNCVTRAAVVLAFLIAGAASLPAEEAAEPRGGGESVAGGAQRDPSAGAERHEPRWLESPPVTRVRAETLRAQVAKIESVGPAVPRGPTSSEEIRTRKRGESPPPSSIVPGAADALPPSARPLPTYRVPSPPPRQQPQQPPPPRPAQQPPGPSYVGDDMQELNEVRAEIERTRERDADLSGREQGLLAGLDELERDIDLQDRLLRGLLDRRERVLGVLVESRAELDWANNELARRQEVFLERLRAMYTLGKYHEYEILLGSRSFVDLVRRYDYVLSVAARDREMHRGVVRQKRDVENREEELRRTAAEISQIEAETEVERANLVERRERRLEMLEEIRSERRAGEEVLAELEESATRLQQLVTQFEEQREIAQAKRGELPTLESADPATGLGEQITGLASRAGTLEWPSEGRVVSEFGRHTHPEFGTVTFNSGIDIEAEAGMPIRCVAGGMVEFISSVPGYGNCVIVNHEDGFYTVYAHASEILVRQGAAVAEGQIIARVGSTGSLAGDRLHFEVRDRKKPVDPLLWLKKKEEVKRR